MKKRLFIACMGLFAMAGTMTADLAHAQAYPNKPIRILVPFPAGSSTDVVARTVAHKLSPKLGQPIIIENKLGAGGNIASQAAATSLADGYTLLMGTVANTVSAAIYDKLTYDLIKDFAPITLVTTAPLIIVANPGLPANNMAELIQYAQSKKGTMTFGSGGNGTAPHLAGEMINSGSNAKIVHVPYKGGIVALTDLMGGQIDIVIGSLIESLSYVQSGKLKAIAVTSAKRTPALPNVPAVSETLPGFEAVGWHGLLAPAGIPKEIIDRLNREVVAILKLPDVQAKLQSVGAVAAGNKPEEFAVFIRNDIAKWSDAVKKSGARAD